MKKIVVLILFFGFKFSYAQFEYDAIRLAYQNQGSTARSIGVGGAFGAVGGDIGAASINPAGLSRLRSTKLYLTTAMANYKNNSNFSLNNSLKSNQFNFQIPNVGLAINIRGNDYENRKPTGFVNFSIGYSMNRLNSYSRNILFINNNNNTSISQSWAEKANGQYVHQLSLYTMERLAYDGLLIDVDTNSSTPKYSSAYGYGNNLIMNQSGSYQTKGSLNDHSFFVSGNYKHKLNFGISLGFKQVSYKERFIFEEIDNRQSTDRDIYKINVNNYVHTKGTGFNAKLGLIYNINDFIRVGYSFHSPTTYVLKDSFSYTIESSFDPNARDPFNTLRLNNSKKTPSAIYKYNITTPLRHVLSACLINKKYGFLSADAELVDFSQINMKADDYSFSNENNSIAKNYKQVIIWRFGGEAIYDKFRFRAGTSITPSHFNDNYNSGFRRENNVSYNLGFGVKNKKTSLDFAFVHNRFKDQNSPYVLNNGEGSKFNSLLSSNNFVFTIAFDLNFED